LSVKQADSNNKYMMPKRRNSFEGGGVPHPRVDSYVGTGRIEQSSRTGRIEQPLSKEVPKTPDTGKDDEPKAPVVINTRDLPVGELVQMSDYKAPESSKKEKIEKTLLNIPQALAYLGYGVTVGVAKTSLSLMDRLLARVDKFGGSMIDKSIPGVGLINGFINFTSKVFGQEKLLADLIENDAAARQKLADKMLKDFQSSQSKHEKGVDAAAKKKARQKSMQKKFGKKTAALLDGAMEMAGDNQPSPVAAPESKAA
jgi:hypothetical protein